MFDRLMRGATTRSIESRASHNCTLPHQRRQADRWPTIIGKHHKCAAIRIAPPCSAMPFIAAPYHVRAHHNGYRCRHNYCGQNACCPFVLLEPVRSADPPNRVGQTSKIASSVFWLATRVASICGSAASVAFQSRIAGAN